MQKKKRSKLLDTVTDGRKQNAKWSTYNDLIAHNNSSVKTINMHKITYLSGLLEEAHQHLTNVMMVLRHRNSFQYKPPVGAGVLAHAGVLHAFG